MGTKQQISKEKLFKIGERLRLIREELHLTQEQMAEFLGISKAHYGLAERGKNCLSLNKYLMLYETYGVDLGYLLTGKEPPKVIVSDIVTDCPQNKVFFMEQLKLIRYARELYR